MLKNQAGDDCFAKISSTPHWGVLAIKMWGIGYSSEHTSQWTPNLPKIISQLIGQ